MKLREIKTKNHHYFRDERGQLQGEYKSWYDNGQQKETSHYRDGEFHGEYKSWYDNGQQGMISYWRDGLIHGEYKRWNWSGRLIDHAFLIDDDEIINFLKNPELYPSTPEEKTMFVLRYGNSPFIKELLD